MKQKLRRSGVSAAIILTALATAHSASAEELAFDSGWKTVPLSETYSWEYDSKIAKINNFYVKQTEGFMSGTNEVQVGVSFVNKMDGKLTAGLQIFCLASDGAPLFATSVAPDFDMVSEKAVESATESVQSPPVDLETAVCNLRVVGRPR